MARKDDISNKSLATLLIVAIVVSIGGTWLVLNKAPGLLEITGLQSSSDTGTAQLTIETVGAIRFAVDTVNWSTGRVNTTNGNDRCILDTEGTNDGNRCINFTTVNAGFQLENDGSQNASIQLAFSNDADGFIGGSAGVNEYRYKPVANETNSCGDQLLAPIWYEVNTTTPGDVICGTLDFQDGSDSIELDINITIPNDATAGTKSSTLTATATTV
jgi:hypothetical protein